MMYSPGNDSYDQITLLTLYKLMMDYGRILEEGNTLGYPYYC